MLKLDSLRKAIVAAIPDLRANPGQLEIFARKGRIVSRAGPALGFQYRYTALVELLDFNGDPDALMVAIMLWARRNQPDLLQAQDERSGFRFDADRLSPTSVDIVVELELDESVATRPRQGGGLDLVHIAEPSAEDVFNPELDDGLGRPPLAQIWLGDILLIPDPAADD